MTRDHCYGMGELRILCSAILTYRTEVWSVHNNLTGIKDRSGVVVKDDERKFLRTVKETAEIKIDQRQQA